MDEYIVRSYIRKMAMLEMAYMMETKTDAAVVLRMIDDAPAADVAPVVHGRWSDAGFGELPKHAPYGWACSVCGGISFNNEYIYCPHCGAIMDGGADHAAD